MDKAIGLEDILEILPTYKIAHGNYQVDNESLCPCGSGNKFKGCCLKTYYKVVEKIQNPKNYVESKRAIENYLGTQKLKQIPGFKLYKKALEKKNVAFCLAKNSNDICSDNRIRYAHTIAESSILKKLNRNPNQSELYTFNRFLNVPSKDLKDYIVSIKSREASIVNTFCSTHDQKLFKDIENDKEYEELESQNLQLALKASALNTYGLILQIMLLQKSLNELEDFWVIQDLHNDYAFFVNELKNIVSTSYKLINEIENNPSGDLYSFSMELNTKLNFAFCEGCIIHYNNDNFLAFINVFPSEKGTWITVSTYSNKGENFINLLEQFKMESDINEILRLVVTNIAIQGTNIYFNQDFVESLGEKEIAILYYYFSSNGAHRIAVNLEEKYLSNYTDEERINLYIKTITKTFGN